MNKRRREDPHDYLGGDLQFLSVQSISDSNSDKDKRLTKAEKKEQRKQANKQWKLMDRKLDSGKDPNPRHTLYYQHQLPDLSSISEWNRFQGSLVEPLPVTFRLGSSCPSIIEKSVQLCMNGKFKSLNGRFVEVRGVVIQENLVKPIPWASDWFSRNLHYHGCNVWQMAMDSQELSKNREMSPISQLLLREVNLGNIVRQELASMLPVMLLDVKCDHDVLDVCSAPGSKTEQILLQMKKQSITEDGLFSGMVVANDADPLRIQTLIKRYSRCSSPNLLVVCSRAEDLQKRLSKVCRHGAFDRIVCDVPCTGDGTFRKFPHLWRLFRPRSALDLHPIQLQIATASVLLLKQGGRFVYSTCSINPIEDEAVVAALLIQFHPSLHLIDISSTTSISSIPGLITRPGLTDWQCSPEIFTSGDEKADVAKSLNRLPTILPSMYPPSIEKQHQFDMNLDRCCRLLPHDNDTGGFFVAVFELQSPIVRKKVESLVSGSESLAALRRMGFNPKDQPPPAELPSHYSALSSDEFQRMSEQLSLQSSLLQESNGHRVLRGGADSKGWQPLQLVSPHVAHALTAWGPLLEGQLQQAGLLLGHQHARDGCTHEVEALHCLAPFTRPSCIATLAADDMQWLAAQGAAAEAESRSSSDPIAILLSQEAKDSLVAATLSSSNSDVLVALGAAPGDEVAAAAAGGKRRLSRAERKKGGRTAAVAAPPPEPLSEPSEENIAKHCPALLLVRVVMTDGRLRNVRVLSPADRCQSLLDALKTVR